MHNSIFLRNKPKTICAEKNKSLRGSTFKTKPQIALQLTDRAKAHGIEVMAWNADELYDRESTYENEISRQ